MPQVRIDFTDQEFQGLVALAGKMGAPSVAAAGKQFLLQAAGLPQPLTRIEKQVFDRIDTLPADTLFTTGELLRALFKGTNFAFAPKKGGAVPSTVPASVGRTLADEANMSSHGYVVDHVARRTNVFRKLGPVGNSGADPSAGSGTLEKEDEVEGVSAE